MGWCRDAGKGRSVLRVPDDRQASTRVGMNTLPTEAAFQLQLCSGVNHTDPKRSSMSWQMNDELVHEDFVGDLKQKAELWVMQTRFPTSEQEETRNRKKTLKRGEITSRLVFAQNKSKGKS